MVSRKTRFAVPDISCDHCRQAIEGAVQPLSGIAGVDVDVPGKVVTVAHDGSLPAVHIADAIEGQGYDVPDYQDVA